MDSTLSNGKGDFAKESTSEGTFAVALDIDGVLLKGNKAIPGAKETIERLQDKHVPFILLTNGGGKTEEAHVRNVGERLGTILSKDQFVQSHTPFYDLVPQYRNKNILVIGGYNNNIRLLAKSYGFDKVFTSSDFMLYYDHIHPFPEMTHLQHKENASRTPGIIPGIEGEEIAAILVWCSSRDWCLDMQLITDLLLSRNGNLAHKSAKLGDFSLPNNGFLQDGQPKLYFCHSDLEWATQYNHPRFAQGAFICALEGIWHSLTKGQAKLEYELVGKPTYAAFAYGEKMLEKYNDCLNERNGINHHIERVYMIGDNPESDIKGANSYISPRGTEWKSVLVETGVYAPGSDPTHKPTRIAHNVGDAVVWAMQQEGMSWDLDTENPLA